ncbi:hypothetical protein [Streptomyces sp. NPDC048665]|uniref:hypothetical protein n=1 Tax=Streptomyces sp. NPDC048665 TaxID=3155490 RepID=UPI003426B071
MNHHTVMLVDLGGDLALLAVAQVVAEIRWRRRCARAVPQPHRPELSGGNPMNRTVKARLGS